MTKGSAVWLGLVLVVEGLNDSVSLPPELCLIVVGTVVGSIHRVLFSLSTHFSMWVPLEVQLMNTKPVSKHNNILCLVWL